MQVEWLGGNMGGKTQLRADCSSKEAICLSLSLPIMQRLPTQT